MSESMMSGGGVAPRGRREGGNGISKTLAPSSHALPALAAAVRKSSGLRSDPSLQAAPTREQEMSLRTPLSPHAAQAIRDAVKGSARQDGAQRKAEASRRLAQAAVDATAAQKGKTEDYNRAVELYFQRGAYSHEGKTLEGFARRNRMTTTQAAQAIASGEAAELGASPEEEKELSAYVASANSDPQTSRARKAMMAGGVVLAMAARSISAEHAAYAGDPGLTAQSLPDLQMLGDEITGSMRKEAGGIEPIHLGNEPDKSPMSILDGMENAIQDTMTQAFERLGEVGSIPIQMHG